jgi:hypothetical protein
MATISIFFDGKILSGTLLFGKCPFPAADLST